MLALTAQRVTTTDPVTVAETTKTIEAISDFATAFGTWQIQIIAIILALDVILGIAAAIASKSFNFNKLAMFMATGVLPFLFGFAVVEIFASRFGIYGQMATTAIFAAIILNLLGSIISNLANLGLNMPTIFKKTRV